MSEPENFLARWSRRKQQAEGASPPEAEPTADPARKAVPAEGASEPAAPSEEPAFDVSTLPPLESIGINSDIRAFLQKGVPLALTRAALRRAWSADPAIRDFIEVAENQWDFASGAVPGFGPLHSSEEIQRLVADIVNEPQPAARVLKQPERETAAADEPNRPSELRKSEHSIADRDRQEPRDAQQTVSPSPGDEQTSIVQSEEHIAPQQSSGEDDVGAMPTKHSHGSALPR